MSVKSDFYARLAAAAGVTALVSTRIYPDALPEDRAYPAVVFADKAEPMRTVHGAIVGYDHTLPVGCWAETRTSADAVADAVVAAIAGSDFLLTGREDVLDPETGLVATLLTVEAFAAT